MTSSCTSSSSSNFFPTRCFFRWRDKWKSRGYHKQQQFVCAFPLNVHLLRWEIVWRNAPRIWRDFGSALPFQTRLTQTKPVLPLSNEHGSQVNDQGRRQCCHNKHKTFPYRPARDVSLLSTVQVYQTRGPPWPVLSEHVIKHCCGILQTFLPVKHRCAHSSPSCV